VPTTFDRLVQNIKINNAEKKVKLFNQDLGESQETIYFTKDFDTTNHVVALNEKCENIVAIEVTALDLCLAEESPSMIKIDVEGYETPVLYGAKAVLEKPTLNTVIMELNGSGERYGYDETLLIKLMLDKGFRTFCYDPLTRQLSDLQGNKTNSGNTIFIRDRSFVEQRIHNAPIVSVNGVEF
jgi:FkbM family methyltransferase